MNIDQCFNLGHVVKAVGLKGECSILLDVDEPSRYKKLESVFIEINKQLVPFFIESIQLRQANFAAVKFQNIHTQAQAEQLTGCNLYLPLTQLPELGENDFYFHELTGYRIVDETKGDIGEITEIVDYGTNVVALTQLQQREIIVPLQKIFFKKIDRTNRIFYTRLPQGLVDLYLNFDPNERPDE